MSSNISEKLSKKLKIALVAGEESGDQLGGPLINSLKNHFPEASFIGVGGPLMIQEGLDSFFSIEKISVMGIIEPLLRLPELIKLRLQLKRYLFEQEPDLFIGIDSPDFNLPISRFLKKNLDIQTIQYVSPSIWAWRKGRLKVIEKSVDRVLTLFPFEEKSYKNSTVEVTYVGHPLADKLGPHEDKQAARLGRGIKDNQRAIALLPGSRRSEVSIMSPLVIEASKMIQKTDPSAKFFMPLVDETHRRFIPEDLDIDHINFSYGDSQEVLSLSDLGIVTSGTASLEALLVRTPVVVAYRTNWLNYAIIKPLLNIKHISLPNLLSDKDLLPELLQKEVTPKNIFRAYKKLDEARIKICLQEFEKIHSQLKAGGSRKVSATISEIFK